MPKSIGFGRYGAEEWNFDVDGTTDDTSDPTGGDTNPPPPSSDALTITGLTVTSDRVMETKTGHLVANLHVTWNAPSIGESATLSNKVHHYLISYSVGVAYGAEATTTKRDVLIPGIKLGIDVFVRVRAVTGAGKMGPYAFATVFTATDDTPPPQPTKPTIHGTLRGASIRWDGKFVDDAVRPDDFRYVRAEASLDPAFPFGSVINAGFMNTAGGTAVFPVGTAPFTIYARLAAIDSSGNVSIYSEVASGGSIQAVPEDIGGGAITNAKLAEAAVTADKILNGAITDLKLDTGAVTTRSLADLSVSVDKVIDGAISAAKTNLAGIDPDPAKGGVLAINSVYALSIQTDAITSRTIVTDAIIARHVVAGAIITEKLDAEAVTADKIRALAITTEKIDAGAVTTRTVHANAITTLELDTGAVTADDIYTYAMTGKVVTSGIFRTGVPGEDRIEIADITAYDPYLGYNRSIRDTIRFIRGVDEFLVGEVRGFMGDIGGWGIHLNSHLELGNVNSVIYQVGRRSISQTATQIRMGSATAFCDGSGNWSASFPLALPVSPTVVVACPGVDAGSYLYAGFCVNSWNASTFGGRMRYIDPGSGGPSYSLSIHKTYDTDSGNNYVDDVSLSSLGGGGGGGVYNPGYGTQFSVRYYAECAV